MQFDPSVQRPAFIAPQIERSNLVGIVVDGNSRRAIPAMLPGRKDEPMTVEAHPAIAVPVLNRLLPAYQFVYGGTVDDRQYIILAYRNVNNPLDILLSL